MGLAQRRTAAGVRLGASRGGRQDHLWKDYSDFDTLMSQAPQTFTEGFAYVDTSWVFDATGLV